MNACVMLLVGASTLGYLPPEAPTDAKTANVWQLDAHDSASLIADDSVPTVSVELGDGTDPFGNDRIRLIKSEDSSLQQLSLKQIRPGVVPVWMAKDAENLADRYPMGFSEVKLVAGNVQTPALAPYPSVSHEGETIIHSGDCCDGGCEESCCSSECCDDCDSGCCGGFCNWRSWCFLKYCRSTCDMPPHFPYPPVYHGYYSFRPYNYTTVLHDQRTVASLGGDPSSPYATPMFEKIYEDLYEEQQFESGSILTPASITPPLPDLQDLLN